MFRFGRAASSLLCSGFSWAVERGFLLRCVQASQCAGFSCGLRASGVAACHLSCPMACPSRDHTRVPCIGRWIRNHWTTREVFYLVWRGSFLVTSVVMHPSLWFRAVDVSLFCELPFFSCTWPSPCRSVSALVLLRKLALCHVFQTFLSLVCLPTDLNFFKVWLLLIDFVYSLKFCIFFCWYDWHIII